MIPRTESPCQTKESPDCLSDSSLPNQPRWQHQLANTITKPAELFDLLALDPARQPELAQACQQFPLRVPRSFVARMEKGNWRDPLLLQVLPQAQELAPQPGYSLDPLAERQQNPLPGLIHKYHGRLLLVVSGACAVNCRYCFRRHFPYAANSSGRQQWQQALAYIANEPAIEEVILSGGDPLVASDRRLRELVEGIAAIPHVQRLRIHSRLPIVLPCRINSDCLAWMTGTRLQTVLVVHSNHPREIDPEVGAALQRLRAAGISVLNQSVLLAGVNDCSDTLASLSRVLFKEGVLPYYLHLLDPVQGACHLDVDEKRAQVIVAELMTNLAGYLVPRLVREEVAAKAKIPVQLIL